MAEVLKVPATAVPLDVPLARMKPPADELDFVEIIMSIEERLKKELPDTLLREAAGTDILARQIEVLTVKALAKAAASSRNPAR